MSAKILLNPKMSRSVYFLYVQLCMMRNYDKSSSIAQLSLPRSRHIQYAYYDYAPLRAIKRRRIRVEKPGRGEAEQDLGG